MGEQDILTDNKINEFTVDEEMQEIDLQSNVIEVVEIEEIKPLEVESELAFSSLRNDVSTSGNHTLLGGRELPDQHPISAIVGLRAELNEIERIKTVLSNGENISQYYLWNDNNIQNEDRCGYFVSFVQGTNHIIKSKNNVIGVTVSNNNAGFIGNKTMNNMNSSYGLVCMSGRVRVRVSSNSIVVGDRIVPDTGGYAKKSTNDYGYSVVSIEDNDGTRYAVICLIPQSTDLFELRDDISDMEDRLDIDEANITSAINTANTALQNAFNTATQVSGQVVTIQSQIQTIIDAADDASETATNASTLAALAQEVATSAKTTAETIQTQVTTDINSMEDDLQDLIDSVEPIVTWDGTNGTTGASYLIDHIQNNLATKTEVSTVDTKTDSALTATQTNAKMIQTVATIEYKYSVGPHSPSNGLIYNNSASGNKIDVLPIGIIYVPTEDVIETTEGDAHAFTFYQGNSYEWNGTSWTEFEDNVALSSSYINGTSSIKYWYVSGSNVIHNDITYPAGSLCLWYSGVWFIVANIKDYNNFHISSRAYQKSNELGAEIANAKGDIVDLFAGIEDDASISATTVFGKAMTLIKSASTNNSAYIENLALYSGEDVIQTIQLNDSPTGTFYTTAPTWDSTNSVWTFSNIGVVSPISPCYGENTEDRTTYYKYICGSYNIWFRNKIRHSESIASIRQDVNSASSKIELLVSNIDGNNTINAASIVAAINGSGSSVTINANKVNISGFVTFSDLSGSGTTNINGSNITTGTIALERLAATTTENGTTKIDGGYIKTGTVTADNVRSNIDIVAPTIKSADNEFYSKMSDSGFEVYETAYESYGPKLQLYSGDSIFDGSAQYNSAALILGLGSDRNNSSSHKGQLIIEKNDNSAVIYYIDDSGYRHGLRFASDGVYLTNIGDTIHTEIVPVFG